MTRRIICSFACTVFAAIVAFASADVEVGHGVFQPDAKTRIPWTINNGHSLIWNGSAYLPVGACVSADPAEITAAAKSGIKDVIVDVMASGSSWDDITTSLRANKLRYLLRLNGIAPMASGIEVAPHTYRLPGITSPQLVTMPMPGAKSALAVLVLKRDGSVLKTERIPVVDGKFNYFVRPGNELEHVLYAYPETKSMQQIDWWEGLDQHRDELMGTLKRTKLDAGLRGIINPLGNLISLPGNDVSLVPTSTYFRSEFRASLADKYRNIDVLQRAWGRSSNGLLSFDEFARLIPLWSGNTGPALLWNPETDKTYPIETRRSSFWRDVTDVISSAANRRFSRLVKAIRKVVDVPVIQEWNGWSPLYEGDQPAADGISARIAGKTPSAVADAASRPSSTVLRQSRAVWQLATDLDPEAPLDELTSIGNRAAFFTATTPAALKKVSESRIEDSAADQVVRPLYFPENAANPAFAQRLPNGMWWLPGPFEGNRIDLGPNFSAYRMKGPSGIQIVMWARSAARVKTRLIKPKLAGFITLDNSDPKPKLLPNGVELALSNYPTIVTGTEDCPVPDSVYVATVGEFADLMKVADSQRRDLFEEKSLYNDYLKAYDTQPFSSITLMRQVNYRVAHKLGIVLWYEAEGSRDSSFSGAVVNTGCSASAVLELRSPVVSPPNGFVASYGLPSTTATYDVWIAAKIPVDKRPDVILVAGSQSFNVLGNPTGVYGTGFGWFKMGSLRTAGNPQSLKLIVSGNAPGDIQVDCIVLTQLPFSPDGLIHPNTARTSPTRP